MLILRDFQALWKSKSVTNFSENHIGNSFFIRGNLPTLQIFKISKTGNISGISQDISGMDYKGFTQKTLFKTYSLTNFRTAFPLSVVTVKR